MKERVAKCFSIPNQRGKASMNKFFKSSGILIGAALAISSPTLTAAQQPPANVAAVQSSTANFPVVQSTELSPYLNIPWSKPVQVADPFEGTFVGVFDRNDIRSVSLGYTGVGSIVSLWTRPSIRMLLTVRQGVCGAGYSAPFPGFYGYNRYGFNHYYRRHASYFYAPPCATVLVPMNVQQLLVKVGDQILRLDGENNVFKLSNEAAATLRNAPEKNVDIRMVLENGEKVDSQIGKGTVKAWRSIY
jgi:hypothetical protein